MNVAIDKFTGPAAPVPEAPLVSAFYRARYQRLFQVGEDGERRGRLLGSGPVETTIGAYSLEDAERRVREETAYYEIEILQIHELWGSAEQVTCTYEGPEDGDGPWQMLDYVDKWAPVIVCDVHGRPAHPYVYDAATKDGPYGREHYSGPCLYHPDLRTENAVTRNKEA